MNSVSFLTVTLLSFNLWADSAVQRNAAFVALPEHTAQLLLTAFNVTQVENASLRCELRDIPRFGKQTECTLMDTDLTPKMAADTMLTAELMDQLDGYGKNAQPVGGAGSQYSISILIVDGIACSEGQCTVSSRN